MLFYLFFLIGVTTQSYGNTVPTANKISDDNPHPCRRTCELGSEPMVCWYKFNVESYHTLSKACYDCPFNVTDCFRPDCVPAEGSKRGIVTINRQIPGPPIEVCQYDTIVVDLYNEMTTESTTLHWHGQHQNENPYMDGVPSVTQCPILPQGTFRYAFKASETGTHLYHSHIGMQRADGAFGALVVRVPKEVDASGELYDFDLPEHTMSVVDWTTEIGTEVFLAHHHNDGSNKPQSILVNGFGRHKEFKDNRTNESVYVPFARFKVQQGYRYRFRVINSGSLNCPIELSVDNHTLTVISTDGNDIKPLEVTSFVSYAGERFDFVLNAAGPIDLYWIKYRGLMDCAKGETFQLAVLQYEGAMEDAYPEKDVTYETAHNDGLQLNPVNVGTSTADAIILPDVPTQLPWEESLQEVPDYQFYIAYDFYKLNNTVYHVPYRYGYYEVRNTKQRLETPQFNHISFETPPFPLLSQRDEITDDMFCNNETLKDVDCITQHCVCPHGIKVPLNAVVELVFIDEGKTTDANHPMHLHGNYFRVVAMEKLGSNTTVAEVKQREADGLIKRNLRDAPLKDSVTVPDGGYTIVRLKAYNPGFWILHCHLEFHAEIGMALILQVGEKDEMAPVPPNFPTCGNYMPDLPKM